MSRTGTRVLLIGLRGSGKTSVGEPLAQLLGVPFLDSDREIESRWGEPVGTVIREHGEREFRRREGEVVRDLALTVSAGVLAVGGGAVLDPTSRQALTPWPTVWLDASDSVLASRIDGDRVDRPLLGASSRNEEISLLRRNRGEIYRQLADLCVDSSSGTPAAVARSILDQIEVD